MRSLPLGLALISALLLAGCQSMTVTRRGSGIRMEQTREVGTFRAIQLAIPARVSVRVGEPASFRIAGDDNVVPDVITEIRDDTLHIEFDDDFTTDATFDVDISCPELTGFAIAGSGTATIEDCGGDKLSLAIAGSGTITATGSAQYLDGTISGSGELALGELRAREANLTISGSGTIDVGVDEQLRYAIAGAGQIHYHGSPHVSGGISGTGHVSAR